MGRPAGMEMEMAFRGREVEDRGTVPLIMISGPVVPLVRIVSRESVG